MSEINNIIFEGRVISTPEVINNGDEKYVRFTLQNRRCGVTTSMPILSYGNLSDKILGTIELGKIVRAVGHLMKIDGELSIVSNHFECKYEIFKKLEADEEEEDEQC